VKTDLKGKLLWQKAYGGQRFDTIDSIIPSSSGGHVVAGFTFSFGRGPRDFWIFSLDDSGNVLWSRTQGREGFEEAYSIIEVAEDQFVFVGWTNSIGNGKYDYYVVKMKVSLPHDSLTDRVLLSYDLAVLAIAAISTLWFWRLQRKSHSGKPCRPSETSICIIPSTSSHPSAAVIEPNARGIRRKTLISCSRMPIRRSRFNQSFGEDEFER
jgi:hypothetical protein